MNKSRDKQKLLISRCLLGDKVRFDGRDCLIEEKKRLERAFELIPICPEMMAGLGVPRQPIEYRQGQLVTKQGKDITTQFEPVLLEIERLIRQQQISYAVLKEDSPSCGVSRLYDGHFSGNLIVGKGHTTKFLISHGISVFSEHDIGSLLAMITE